MKGIFARASKSAYAKNPVLGCLVFATVSAWILISFFRLRGELPGSGGAASHQQQQQQQAPSIRTSTNTNEINRINEFAQHLIDYPIQWPYRNRFGEMGSRLRLVREWIELADAAAAAATSDEEKVGAEVLRNTTERVLGHTFPFLLTYTNWWAPFADLRQRFTGKQKQGIVIPTGTRTFRFACHLVVSLRKVLDSKLPIQIVYAGDFDLPPEQREEIASLSKDGDITFMDILTVFEDKTLKLGTGGWAIKAFAALAAPFEEVILLDADTVFLQKPEMLLQQRAYAEKGALLFHDRLLWQHAFQDRHRWWHAQIKFPSLELNKSLVWTQEYAEEADSGVVVLNKSRLDVLLGLLHTAWQNTEPVREETTYKLTYGDKESWWLGLELAGSQYAFEKHYAGIVGWMHENGTTSKKKDDGKKRVCSFVIAHVDEEDKLIWYNGGLAKNKMTMPDVFEVPTHWMIDADWEKGAAKEDMSCIAGGKAIPLTKEESAILAKSMKLAEEVDSSLALIDKSR
ncbi:mannosyltransferase putative-domain-containing protein [Diplogelasinospora grovesii]|uniref:Mannosyltransferase putative-domain-containing protein n=1 Tax=Diplogelasinospora grovesii TaxID=303347 RepID=A0AAN6N479_9PEZI|nr:mannosyltransferase putative-domain-containing protein [Diplogelasinospora grovesii]